MNYCRKIPICATCECDGTHSVIYSLRETVFLRRRMAGCLCEECFERENRSMAGLEISFLLSWRTAASRRRTAELMQHIIIPAREAHYKNSTLQCDALHTLDQHFSASTTSRCRLYIGHHVVAQSCLSYKGEQTFNCIDATYIFVADVQPNYLGTLIEWERGYFEECGYNQTVSGPHWLT